MIVEAIKKINPNAEFSYTNNDLNSIQWHNGTTPIPIADIQAKITEVENEYKADQYKRDRQAEFNTKSIQDQLDMQYHDAVNGTTTWKDWVKSVKDNHPKPTE